MAIIKEKKKSAKKIFDEMLKCEKDLITIIKPEIAKKFLVSENEIRLENISLRKFGPSKTVFMLVTISRVCKNETIAKDFLYRIASEFFNNSEIHNKEFSQILNNVYVSFSYNHILN